MRAILFAALAASAVAPFDVRDFFSSTESKMSAGAHQAVGATKSIVKKVLPPRPQVAGSSVAPLLQAAVGPPSPPPPGAIACTPTRKVGKPPAPRFSGYAKSLGTGFWGEPEDADDHNRDDCADRSPTGPYRWKQNSPAKGGKGGSWLRDKGKGVDATKTARNQEGGAKQGKTATELRNEHDIKKGLTPAEGRRQREAQYLMNNPFLSHIGRRPTRDSYGNIAAAHEMLQLPHITAIHYPYEYTEAEGSKPLEEHMQARSKITQTFYSWYNPSLPPKTMNGNSLRTATDGVKTCRLMAGTDLEFNHPNNHPDDDLDPDGRTVWPRIYDFAITVHDCYGEVNPTLSWHKRNDNYMPLDGPTKQEGLDHLKKLHGMGILIYSWGNPELTVFEKAGVRMADGSSGFDMRQALLSVLKGCKPSATTYPFSLSQNVLVPFLGIRGGPFHKAKQDTFDEAVTVTTLLWGLLSFWKSRA